MSKKVIAIILAVIIAFSTSITVAAASSIPQVNELVSAILGDVEAFKNSIYKLKTLSKQLQSEMEPYIMDVVLTTDNIETAIDLGSRLMIKIIEGLKPQPPQPTDPSTDPGSTDPGSTDPGSTDPGSTDPGSTDPGSTDPKPTDPSTDPSTEPTTQPSRFQITIAELKRLLSKYLFVKVDDIDEATREILEGNGILDENGEGNGVKYYVFTLQDGTETVYIAVDIGAHPDIFNYEVFRKTVEAIYEQQGKELEKDKDGNVDYLMSYEHIAGELAMHAIIYAIMNEFIEVTGTKNATILKLYESAVKADLNIDEARIPSALISILGVLLIDMFAFRFLKLFKPI